MNNQQKKRVAVLMGGWSDESEVSLDSGRGVVNALKELGHDVIPIHVKKDLSHLIQSLTPKPDVVFNALHGVGGEDGVIQGVLDMMEIPYTHSSLTASALGMNKLLSRKIFQHDGLPTPEWTVVSYSTLKTNPPLPLPFVIKPINQGSSRGVIIIKTQDDLQKIPDTWTYGDDVLVEKFIKGKEIQVAILGGKAIGAIEIRPYTGFYDYVAKYTPGKAEHIMPAPISVEAYKKVQDIALKAHYAIGCKGFTRVDFIYEEEKDCFYMLEVNTQPGITSLSLAPEIAAHVGINYTQLIDWIVNDALCPQQV